MPRQGKICEFKGCLSRSKKNPGKKFYPFIKPWMDRERCLRWIAATGRNDFTVEDVNYHRHLCEDHFVDNGPSVENPDPLPYEEVSIDDPTEVCAVSLKECFSSPKLRDNSGNPVQGESLMRWPNLGSGVPPKRRGALEIKKKVLPPKKTFKQASSSLPVAVEEKGTNQTLTSELCHSTPEAVPEDIQSRNRNLFDEFMAAIDENDGSSEKEGVFAIHDGLSQDTSVDHLDFSHAFERDGKCTVKTQTLSQWTLNRLTARGKLSKSTTSSTGVQILSTSADCEVDNGAEESSTEVKEKNPTMLSFESITSDDDFEYLSGLSRQNFKLLYLYLGGDEVCFLLKHEAGTGTPKMLRDTRLTLRSRLFMTLCHLRRGFRENELAIFFGCGVSLVSRILNTWINFLYIKLKPLEERMFQDRRSQTSHMPQRLRSIKGLRVIIDCTEIKLETQSKFQQLGNTWSSYNHSNTVKYLIGINVHGAVCYVSEAFEGSKSDKEVFMQSTMCNLLEPGDVVMADEGFDISEALDRIKVKLVILPYLNSRNYLTPEEEIWSKNVARARIFVENAIGRLKMWRILNSTFPESTTPLVSKMMFVCVCLSNFQASLLSNFARK